MAAGIDCYMSQGTSKALGLSGHRVKIVEPMRQFEIGAWKILPFLVEHDAVEPLGFLLQIGQNKICFLTDTAFTRYRFRGLTHVMIECNYQKEILDKTADDARKKRIIETHMGLDTCLSFLAANDLSNVREIHLLHCSAQNSNVSECKKKVVELTGVPVYYLGE